MTSVISFIKAKREYIFELLFCFIGCGIFGWAFETIDVLIQDGALTDRGILFISHIGNFPIVWGLPFILIYAIGGAVLILVFKPLAKKPILLFFIGMVSMTTLEYLTALMCETLLNQVLWDYSNKFMNFQGRICLVSSIMWGLLSLLAVEVFAPVFHKAYGKIKNKHIMHIIILVLIAYIIVCYILRPILFPTMV
ncbi:MAG: putative ABC transporter permease [Oscillospiraceae bacterium]|nr:putative ABC transporter permease [Oscillospiraceae bacterium]